MDFAEGANMQPQRVYNPWGQYHLGKADTFQFLLAVSNFAHVGEEVERP